MQGDQPAASQEQGEEEENEGEAEAETESKEAEDSGAEEDETKEETGETEEEVEGEGKEEEGSKEEEGEKTTDQSGETDEGVVADAEPSEEDKTAEETESTEQTETEEEKEGESAEQGGGEEEGSGEAGSGDDAASEEAPQEEADKEETKEESVEETGESKETVEEESTEKEEGEEVASGEEQATEEESKEEEGKVDETEDKVEESQEEGKTEESVEESGKEEGESTEEKVEESVEEKEEEKTESVEEVESTEGEAESVEDVKTEEESKEAVEEEKVVASEKEEVTSEPESKEEATIIEESTEAVTEEAEKTEETEKVVEDEEEELEEETPEEDLTLDVVIPEKLRPREHISEILRLGPEAAETENLLSKTIEVTLRELKRLYDNAIKPLEILYKYRDLSNRHFGDPEIFSKPLILFMGPWSGGKSSIINYLLDNEYKKSSLRTGAEPSPAYFNILMWGNETEVLDGTQLAADWTFSGLQKFGQGLLDRLRGLRLDSPLLEKVNIVEIPGILEIRKQVERMFPFNDACQWFIDRADIIFLVYDPSKLDVGPETEAILDQLKGREYQTRIILNKADQVKPEELMRVQGTLIWNISPLMSSSEPPVMYSTSLWSLPYEAGAPIRLLHAQERAFLRDFREAIDKRVENKIASARRFAVRVRNHAKMVDCYLTTFYNHKTFFGNKKKVADDIIEHPQNYHIYEGLSTLTNISRYDLPDPDVYRDFFRLNPIYEFQQLATTCTYFRGCPINRLDIAIAYDLPELVGKYKKSAEHVLASVAAAKTKS
ncbi:sarcalumenin isoform X2 [Nilaparvata lugens]|nr:sarcalumenin isoform X2 [Nilaparvata lugens]